MAKKIIKLRHHETLRVPQGWNSEERAFVMQIERNIEDIYKLFYINDGSFEAGTYGPTADVEGNNGTTVKIPAIVVGEDGKIKEIKEFTLTNKDTTYSFTDKDTSLSWNTRTAIATIGGVDIHVKMPANPNTNTWREYVVKTYSYAYSNLTAGETIDITGSQLKDSNNAVVSTPSGYVPVAVLQATTGSQYVDVSAFRGDQTGSNWLLRLRNESSSARSGTAYISILYLKTGNP